MKIKIQRKKKNSLYTEGILHLNDESQLQTVECTAMMLPPGLYLLRLVSINAHCRELVILDCDSKQPTGQRISPTAISHIGCRREQAIAIGHELIPGALYRSLDDYERIVKRIEKRQQRGKPILLVIDDSDCHAANPAKHWVTLNGES